MNYRAVHILNKTVKGKKVYYFLVLTYGLAKPHTVHPNAFKKTFGTRKEAVSYAYATIEKLNDKSKTIRYMSRFLNDK